MREVFPLECFCSNYISRKCTAGCSEKKNLAKLKPTRLTEHSVLVHSLDKQRINTFSFSVMNSSPLGRNDGQWPSWTDIIDLFPKFKSPGLHLQLFASVLE